jgi:orotate phosphoribosyltransferase-like protein
MWTTERRETMGKQITIGDSTRGYHTATITETSGKYRLVVDSIIGDGALLRRAVKALNEGGNHVVINVNGDDLPFSVR